MNIEPESDQRFDDGNVRCPFRHRWNPVLTRSVCCPRCGGRPFIGFTSEEPRRGWFFYFSLLAIPAAWVFSIVLAINATKGPEWSIPKLIAACLLFSGCAALVFRDILFTARFETAVDRNRAQSLAEIYQLTFSQAPPPEVAQIVTGLDLFRKKKQPDFTAVLTGIIEGREVIGGRLSWWEGSDSEGCPMSKRLLIYPGLGQHLPQFELRARGTLSQVFYRLFRWRSLFDDRKFGRKFAIQYSLKGSETERLREVFDEFLLERFAESPHWFISNDHGQMVFERTLPDQSFQFRTGKTDLEPPAEHQYETWEMASLLARHFADKGE